MMGTLCLDKNEILRYLGYKNQVLDKKLERLLDDCMDEMRSLTEGRHVYKFFNIAKDNGKIVLKDCLINLEGTGIYKHLETSKTCILMAATLGSEVDTRIRYYEKTDMTRALILDSCASTAIEEVCDRVCSYLEKIVGEKGKTLTSRYSPGYGDLPIDIQKSFISALGADKSIGLTASSSNILIPRKSVTAIIGVASGNSKPMEKNCLKCSKYSDCQYRRERGSCGP